MFADELSDAALDAALEAMKHASSPFSLIQFRGLGGALARVGNDATAFAHRDKRYFVAIIGIWLDAAEDAAVHSAWTESLWQTIRPEGSGVYVNFLEREGAERVRDAYPPATFARLVEINGSTIRGTCSASTRTYRHSLELAPAGGPTASGRPLALRKWKERRERSYPRTTSQSLCELE
jgi:hypothetical protein